MRSKNIRRLCAFLLTALLLILPASALAALGEEEIPEAAYYLSAEKEDELIVLTLRAEEAALTSGLKSTLYFDDSAMTLVSIRAAVGFRLDYDAAEYRIDISAEDAAELEKDSALVTVGFIPAEGFDANKLYIFSLEITSAYRVRTQEYSWVPKVLTTLYQESEQPATEEPSPTEEPTEPSAPATEPTAPTAPTAPSQTPETTEYPSFTRPEYSTEERSSESMSWDTEPFTRVPDLTLPDRTTQETEASSSEEGVTPQTGDPGSLLPVVMLGLSSGAALLLTGRKNRKK